jgi:hypothetical protein
MAFLTSRLRAVVAASLLATMGAAPVVAQAPRQASEYQVKAAMVYGLLKFVEWPADAFSTAAAPVSICLVGADPFGPLLDDAVRGRLMAGHPIVIRRLTDAVAGCHLLFISTSESRRLPVILDRLAATSVLTVSDLDDFAAHGGMIEMRSQRDHVAFVFNVDAADRAHLRLSARLLSLGSTARPAKGEAR